MKRVAVIVLLAGLASAATLTAQPIGPGALSGLAGGLVAPGEPGGPGGPPNGPGPDQVLRDVLGFSQAQLDALHQHLQNRQQATEALVKQLPDAEKALQDAAGAATPDPTKVGAAFLQIQAIQKQIGQVGEAFKTAFNGLLTADQQSKVAAIRALQAGLLAGGVLRQLGL